MALAKKNSKGIYKVNYPEAIYKGVVNAPKDTLKKVARGIVDRLNYQVDKSAEYGKKYKESFDSYKKGGIVKKTGLALVHKGELVVPKSKVKKYHKTRGKVGI